MKKIIFLYLLTLISSGCIFATSGPGAPEKIKELFHHQFPEIQKEAFFSYGDSYEVYFKKESNSSERIYYNLDGEITKTIKYYGQSELEPFIKEKLNKKYKGKTIFDITELQSDAGHFYKIILMDNNNLYVVKSDDKGSLKTEKVFKNGWGKYSLTRAKFYELI
jgi:hypothetical protein